MVEFNENAFTVFEDDLLDMIVPTLLYSRIVGFRNPARFIPGDIIGGDDNTEAISQIKCFSRMYYILF